MIPPDSKLLILDNDPMAETTIGLIAEGAGFAWKSARRGEDFFELLSHWQPSHLIINLTITGSTQVLDRLAAMGSRTRIVLATDTASMLALRPELEREVDLLGVVFTPFTALPLRALLLASTSSQEAPVVPRTTCNTLPNLYSSGGWTSV